MPRKFWKQKNRYCWNSNLSEEIFLALLRLYCTGYTCSRAAIIVGRYARRYGLKRVSRQTANRYYLMFGDYLYEALPDQFKVENFPLEQDDDMPEDEELRRLYIANIVLTATHHVLYGRLEWNDDINDILLAGSNEQIHYVLSAFSKARRGYPLETFNAHLAYCMWTFLITKLRPDDVSWRALYTLMKDSLEAAPLDIRSHRSLRIAKP